MAPSVTRVLLVDDHPLFREGVRHVLGGEPALEVVGSCGDGIEALRLAQELRPDLVLLDLGLPGLSGLEVNRRLSGAPDGPAVLILTWQYDEAYAAQLAADGARGFVTKDADPRALLRAIREIGAGRDAFPPTLRMTPSSTDVSDPWGALTDREREVAQLTAEGWTCADAGARLGISRRTVEVHRANVYRKLRVASAPELVHFLVRRGLFASGG